MNMSETFEQFCERMGRVEKVDEIVVGPRCAGNSRAIFDFEDQRCFLETTNLPDYRPLRRAGMSPLVACVHAITHPPSFQWVHSRLFYTKKRAKMLAKHYGAKFDEDPYPREEGVWFYLYFTGKDDFEKLMRLVWDIHTGEFQRMFGDEAKRYESCIGWCREEAEVVA
jgi:hypothetical protein